MNLGQTIESDIFLPEPLSLSFPGPYQTLLVPCRKILASATTLIQPAVLLLGIFLDAELRSTNIPILNYPKFRTRKSRQLFCKGDLISRN